MSDKRALTSGKLNGTKNQEIKQEAELKLLDGKTDKLDYRKNGERK
jgi:hypothetical protein